MQVHIENIPPSAIVYMRHIGSYGERNYKLMQDMKQWIQDRNLWSEEGVIYGIAQDNASLTSPDKCRYDVCFVTDSTFEDEAIHHGTLPTGTYLVFKVIHTADEVQRFYVGLGDAMAKEEKQIDEQCPILERYQFSLIEKGYCEFCVPIL